MLRKQPESISSFLFASKRNIGSMVALPIIFWLTIIIFLKYKKIANQLRRYNNGKVCGI